jgi:hypothetical protein
MDRGGRQHAVLLESAGWTVLHHWEHKPPEVPFAKGGDPSYHRCHKGRGGMGWARYRVDRGFVRCSAGSSL